MKIITKIKICRVIPVKSIFLRVFGGYFLSRLKTNKNDVMIINNPATHNAIKLNFSSSVFPNQTYYKLMFIILTF